MKSRSESDGSNSALRFNHASSLSVAVGVRFHLGELADVAMERHVRQPDLERDIDLLDHPVPAGRRRRCRSATKSSRSRMFEGRERGATSSFTIFAVDEAQHRIGAAFER